MNFIGGRGYPSMAEISALLTAATIRENNLTPEEREKRKHEREEVREAHRVAVCIRQGECPECHKKLVRGKKNRKNDYKRDWLCENCDSIHSL